MNEEIEILTMRIIQDIQENDMVAAFLRAEVDSPRFGPLLADQLRSKKISPSILREPDVRNDMENQTRADLLSESRGYRRNAALFHGFPDDCQWKLVAMTRSDLNNVKYINYDYWVELSGGTRLVADAAKWIRSGKVKDEFIDECILAVARDLARGKSSPEMILATDEQAMKLVVLEGHVRMTAYVLTPAYIPRELRTIVGFSPNIDKWTLY